MKQSGTSRNSLPELLEIVRGGCLRTKDGTELRFSRVYFPEYDGHLRASRLRRPIVGLPTHPFAELQIVQRHEAGDCKAA